MTQRAYQWPKNLHLQNIKKSGLYRFEKEIGFEESFEIDAEKFCGMIESQGSVQQALKTKNATFVKELETIKREILKEMVGTSKAAMISYRLRLAIKRIEPAIKEDWPPRRTYQDSHRPRHGNPAS